MGDGTGSSIFTTKWHWGYNCVAAVKHVYTSRAMLHILTAMYYKQNWIVKLAEDKVYVLKHGRHIVLAITLYVFSDISFKRLPSSNSLIVEEKINTKQKFCCLE